ncbi:MAG: tyrosine-type recombinase/integrase [Bdellovibrionota bacterium]
MAVTSYLGKNSETLWKVSASSRSAVDLSVRVQKAKFGFATEREAEREETKLLRECEREVLSREAQGSSWGSVLEAWTKSLNENGLADATRTDYVAAAYNHTANWIKRPAAEITPLDVKELFGQLKAHGRSYDFIKRMKNMLGRIFMFGMEKRLIKGLDKAPTFGVQLGRAEEKKPEILTITEIRKLLSTARELKHPWYHHWAMALLTGMRSGELYALLWTDIDWDNNAITVSKSYDGRFNVIKSTKAGYWRTVPVSAELRSLLLEVRSTASDRPHVLPRPRMWTMGMQAQELRMFCLGAGIPSVRFHALRACFATQLIRNGVPPIQIQKICGWRDLKTMQRYIRMAGIEVTGATEALKVLPEADIAAKVVNLFTGESVQKQSE